MRAAAFFLFVALAPAACKKTDAHPAPADAAIADSPRVDCRNTCDATAPITADVVATLARHPEALRRGLTLLDADDDSLAPLARIAASVESLSIGCASVKTLRGIDAFTALQELDLAGAPCVAITDLSPLGRLTHLRKVDVAAAGTGDIAFVTTLPDLESLRVTDTPRQVKGADGLFHPVPNDARPLASTTHLRVLSLSHWHPADASPLASLSELRDLTLDHAELATLEPLAKASRLETLSLVGAKVGDWSALRSLTSLHRLVVARSTFTDTQLVAGLPHLEEVDTTGCNLVHRR